MNVRKQQLLSAVVAAALAIGFFSALLGNTLKALTDYYEHRLFSFSESYRLLLIVLPAVVLFAIYLLRHILFRNKPNKGIREIFDAIRQLNREDGLTVLIVEQNANHALRLAHRGYVMVNGSITLSGPGEELLRRPEIRAAYLEGGRH